MATRSIRNSKTVVYLLFPFSSRDLFSAHRHHIMSIQESPLIQKTSARCRTATANDAVLHGECAYTFHTPFTTPRGILVSLDSFVGMCQEKVFSQKKDQQEEALFLRIVKNRIVLDDAVAADEPTLTPLAIDTTKDDAAAAVSASHTISLLDDHKKYDIVSTYSVVLVKDGTIVAELPYVPKSSTTTPTSTTTLPDHVVASVESILCHAGISTQHDVQASTFTTDIPMTKYAADLPFVANTSDTIDPNDAAQWKCQQTNTTRDKDNLWMNLSDGFLGGGRQHWDGTGGTNGALDHYRATGFPLVVKLGTISRNDSNGKVTADCYSYAPDEDGPVIVPNLKEWLERRGVKVESMYVLYLLLLLLVFA
jgi:ubiquitin carboxyl-terminal hydrolase 5/13